MLKTIKKLHSVLVLFMVVFFVSCDQKVIFDEYVAISNGWDKENKISFNFVINDTLSKRNLYINLRNNNAYAYSNLFLITQMTFPGGQQMIDTLEYDMTDEKGRFLGKGITEIKENKLFYKEKIIFPIKGSYIFKVRQAMRKIQEPKGIKQLKGITDVGFRIEKTNNYD